MSNVTPIGTKVKREGWDGTRCSCGGAWFKLVRPNGQPGAVVLDKKGHIFGYAGHLVCTSCGKRLRQ
jgi:hypothetical protein